MRVRLAARIIVLLKMVSQELKRAAKENNVEYMPLKKLCQMADIITVHAASSETIRSSAIAIQAVPPMVTALAGRIQ